MLTYQSRLAQSTPVGHTISDLSRRPHDPNKHRIKMLDQMDTKVSRSGHSGASEEGRHTMKLHFVRT